MNLISTLKSLCIKFQYTVCYSEPKDTAIHVLQYWSQILNIGAICHLSKLLWQLGIIRFVASNVFLISLKLLMFDGDPQNQNNLTFYKMLLH